MRKIQLACNAGGHFRRGFIEKYPDIDFLPYTNQESEAFFFGCYGEKQIEQARLHDAKLYLCWTGGDIRWLRKNPHLIDSVRGEHITHIAISSFIENDLKEWGIPFISAPVLPFKTEAEPCPLGDSIYVYKSQSPLYGRDLNNWVKRHASYKVIECDFHSYSRKEIFDIYKKCFVGLRFTPHDGLSNTVCEMGLMGRKVLWNGNTPNALPWNKDNVLELIEEAKNVDYMKVSKDMREFLSNDLIARICK